MKYDNVDPFEKLHEGEPYIFMAARNYSTSTYGHLLYTYARKAAKEGQQETAREILSLRLDLDCWRKTNRPVQEKAKSVKDLIPGEPYFFLRAKDIFSVEVLETYLHKKRYKNAIDYEESLPYYKAMLQEFSKWQELNADKVKRPD